MRSAALSKRKSCALQVRCAGSRRQVPAGPPQPFSPALPTRQVPRPVTGLLPVAAILTPSPIGFVSHDCLSYRSLSQLALFFRGRSCILAVATPYPHSTCPTFRPSRNWVRLAQKPRGWGAGVGPLNPDLDPVPKQIGFVLPKPLPHPSCRNSLPAQHLSLQSRPCRLGSFGAEAHGPSRVSGCCPRALSKLASFGANLHHGRTTPSRTPEGEKAGTHEGKVPCPRHPALRVPPNSPLISDRPPPDDQDIYYTIRRDGNQQ